MSIMNENMDICYICLRTDRKLKDVNTKLSNFHRELSDVSMGDLKPQYCYECEHLLKKTYNFKAKCMRAMGILQQWIITAESVREPIARLSSRIPSLLEYQNASEIKQYNFQEEDLMTSNSSVHVTIKRLDSNNDVFSVDSVDVDANTDTAEHNGFQDILVNTLSIPKVKEEISEEESKDVNLNNFLDFKNEETANKFEEILINNETPIEPINNESDDENKDNYNETDNATDNSEIKNILNDLNFSSDDNETLLAIMKNSKTKKSKTKQKKSRKRSLHISDSESEYDVGLRSSKRKKSAVTKEKNNKRSTKKVKDEQSLSNDIKEEESDSKKIKDEDSNKKSRFHTRKSIIAELTNGQSDDIGDSGYKRKPKSYLKRPYTKERLIEEIESRFSDCGELTASDGTVLDKQFILQCLRDRATDFVMNQLYQAVYHKTNFKPKALKLFKCIQNKYKTEYESVFEILYLNTKEKMIQEFEERKNYASYITADYKCEVCYQGFKHEKMLQYHNKCHDQEISGDCICSICRMRFKTKKALINHLNMHEAVYKCKLCPLVTYYKNSMKNHYQQHKGTTYKCEQCSTTFQSMSAYRTHMSYRHVRAHVCTACGRAYSTRVGLRAHTTKHHQNEREPPDAGAAVECDKCSLTLSSWDAYNRHLRVTHKQAMRGRPPGGTNSTVNRNYDTTLQRKRPIMTCRVCNMEGNSLGWLQLHFSELHPTADMEQLYADKHRHLCDICGKGFSNQSSLQAHLNMHSGNRPYVCEVCNSRFYRAMSLRTHRQIHKPPSRPCPRCGKKFRSASNLNNHMRSHIGDRRYKCNICGKGFLHRNSLNEHIRGVHNNIRRVRKRGLADDKL